MTTLLYHCDKCNFRFEVMDDCKESALKCSICNGKVKRIKNSLLDSFRKKTDDEKPQAQGL